MNAFVERYSAWTGDAPEDILMGTARRCLRVNPLQAPKDLVKRLREKGVTLEKVPFLEHAYWYDAPFSLGATEEYLLGYYYLQEAASQAPVAALCELMDVSEKTILDMAAAPGSKTTQLAAAMNNTGTIVALDENRKRCGALGNNLERCGASNTFVYLKDARYADDLNMTCDAVLLDAPCSGNFTLQRNWFSQRSIDALPRLARVQKTLLHKGLSLLKPRGVLVYSTCSLEKEENEDIVSEALSEAFELCNLSLGDVGIDGVGRRFWPHRTETQGFFVAAIKRVS